MNNKLVFPRAFNFECIGCGSCCRDWNIHVDRESYRTIKESAIYRALQQKLGEALFIEERDDGTVSTMRKDTGECIFLTDKTRCIIHSKMGYRSKPLGCRQFPFKLMPTPDGIFAGVSFYCPSCRQNTGRPLESYREEIGAWLDEHHYKGIDEENIQLYEGISLDWTGYLAIQEFLSSSIEKSNDLEYALCDSLMRLSIVVLIARQRSIQKLTSEEVLGLIEKASRFNIAVDEMFRQLGMFYTLAVAGVLESDRDLSPREITGAMMEGGVFRSATFGKEISMASFSGYYLGNPAPWKLPPVKRYVAHLLFRKFLLGREPVLCKIAALYTAFGLVELYLYLNAYQGGKSAPDIEDLHFALGVAEKGFAAHTILMTPFFRVFAEGFLDQVKILT